MNPENPHDQLDEATAQRLAQLRSMPVDTSRLDRMIRAEIPQAAERRMMLFAMHPLRAIAASILILGFVGLMFYSLSGGPVLASADVMAQLHTDLIAGKQGAIPVTSIEEAGRKLAYGMPSMPAEHAMVCCMHSIKDKRVACVLLKTDGDAMVTLAVADAMDMRLPGTPPQTRGAATYHVQSSGKLNMVMTNRDGRWICLIGELPGERLMDIAAAVKF